MGFTIGDFNFPIWLNSTWGSLKNPFYSPLFAFNKWKRVTEPKYPNSKDWSVSSPYIWIFFLIISYLIISYLKIGKGSNTSLISYSLDLYYKFAYSSFYPIFKTSRRDIQ